MNRTIKPAHRRRGLVAATHLKHRARACFPTISCAGEANASLSVFRKAHGKFNLILADFPWAMAPGSKNAISPEHHYPTMAPAALLNFDLDVICAKDAVIGFWALVGQTSLAYRILDCYGFKAITQITWHKVRRNGADAVIPTLGPALNTSEVFIIAKRGKGLPINRLAEQFKTVMTFERTGHSCKPDAFRKMLQKLYPVDREGRRVKRLELFARQRKWGWKVWGNQAPAEVGGAARALHREAA